MLGATPPAGERLPVDDLTRVTALMDEHAVQVVRVGAADMDGVFRGKRVTRDHFLRLCKGDGIAQCDVIFGWDIAEEVIGDLPYSSWAGGFRDVLMRPDLATFAIVPWEPGCASVICDLYTEDGEEFPVTPRAVLKRVVASAAAMGYGCKMAVEYEVRFFRETQQTLRAKDYQGLQPLSPGLNCYSIHHASIDEDVIGELRRQLIAYGIPVEGYNREHGEGMYEINLRYDDAVAAADKAMLYKSAAKEVSARSGVIPTFMAKYSDTLDGCSGHIHQSLWRGETNAFWDEGAPHHLSVNMRHYLGGALALLPEMMALFAPNVNSYKRFVRGTWAPTTASWGIDNRTAALRVIAPDDGGCRIEHRVPGADLNPYLGFAACIAGGLHGLERETEPPPAIQGDAYATEGPPALPATLRDAVGRFESSAAARAAFGDGFVDHYAAMRRWEVARYDRAVTDWERRRYFEMV
jgi:glutamine synthetase